MFSSRTERIVIATALVVVAVILVALFGRSTPPVTAGVLFASEPWPRGSSAASVILEVPERLAPLLVAPDDIGDRVAAIDIPANTFLTPDMLRPPGLDRDGDGGLTRLRLAVRDELWPFPGPFGGDLAVIGNTGSSCALAVTELLDVDAEGGAVTIAVDPVTARQLLSAGDLAVWPPAGTTWPQCLPVGLPPILETPRGTSRLRLAVNTDRWPAPGPVPGDLGAFGPIARACSVTVTRVLDSDGGGNVTIAVTPQTAARLVPAGDLAVWPPGSAVWPACEPELPVGLAPVRLQVDMAYWPTPGPADGDLAVIGPSGSGCAWIVTNLLRADGVSITLAANPEVAARLMAEPLLAVWSPTTEGTWPYCDDVPVETVTAAVPAGSASACIGAGRTWNPDTQQCETL